MGPAKMVNGSYTLDIDPNCFEVILNWLRHRRLMIPSTITLDSVLVVAEFYGLHYMVEQLKQALIGESIVLEVRMHCPTAGPRRWISTEVSDLCVLARHDPQLMRKILQKIDNLGRFVCRRRFFDERNETIDSIIHLFSDQSDRDFFIEHPGECGTREVVKAFMDVGGFSVKTISTGVWALSK